MNGLTVADFADTGQWRLILKIFNTGIVAYLENTIHTDLEPQMLFSTQWEADGVNLLRNIENAVYDHPRVLDDFSAKIIIYDPRTVFLPTELAEESEGGEVTVAYAPARGLKGFLRRTFPGARVECNLMDMLKRCRNDGEGYRMYVEVREGEADFVFLNGRDLISASTHGWTSGDDIVYHALNIMEVYGVAYSEVACRLTGDHLPEETAEALGKFCGNKE